MYQHFWLFYILDVLGYKLICIALSLRIGTESFHSFQIVIDIGWLTLTLLIMADEELNV